MSRRNRSAGGCAIAALAALAAFGAGPGAAAALAVPRADGERMFAIVESLVSFGPRAPGTAGHDVAAKYLRHSLEASGADVTLQGFRVRDAGGAWHAATNVIGRYRGDSPERVLLGAHWDTRPRAEHDPDPARRDEAIVGANDGGSGTAVLLHLAELMRDAPPPLGVDLVFFDAEDWGLEGDHANYCLGAKHFASNLPVPPPYRAAVIVDMVGDADLAIPREEASLLAAPRLVERLWGSALRLGANGFSDASRSAMYDDHIPLIEVGIPTVLMIDFDYPAWHTHADQPDQLSPRSLEQVASVLIEWIYGGAPQQ